MRIGAGINLIDCEPMQINRARVFARENPDFSEFNEAVLYVYALDGSSAHDVNIFSEIQKWILTGDGEMPQHPAKNLLEQYGKQHLATAVAAVRELSTEDQKLKEGIAGALTDGDEDKRKKCADELDLLMQRHKKLLYEMQSEIQTDGITDGFTTTSINAVAEKVGVAFLKESEQCLPTLMKAVQVMGEEKTRNKYFWMLCESIRNK